MRLPTTLTRSSAYPSTIEPLRVTSATSVVLRRRRAGARSRGRRAGRRASRTGDAERRVGVEHAGLRRRAEPIVSSRLVSRKSSSVPIEPGSASRSMFTPSTSRGSSGWVLRLAGGGVEDAHGGGQLDVVRARADEADAQVARDLLELDTAVDVDVEPAAAAVGQVGVAEDPDRLACGGCRRRRRR